MSQESRETRTESLELRLEPGQAVTRQSLTITGPMPNLHDDPDKVRKLLDLLELPQGTQVQIVTNASSVIVR